jgi:large subunit ribosomal protein L17
MYKNVKKAKLGRKTSNRKALINNQLRSLFESSHVVTTSPKAKALKSNAQRLIATGKKQKGSLVLRRNLAVILKDEKLVKKFMEYVEKEIAGVRIVKIGFRKGDNGEKSKVELIGMEKKLKKVVKKTEEKKEAKKDEKAAATVKEPKKVLNRTKDNKSIDKSAVVKKTERAKTRSGL